MSESVTPADAQRLLEGATEKAAKALWRRDHRGCGWSWSRLATGSAVRETYLAEARAALSAVDYEATVLSQADAIAALEGERDRLREALAAYAEYVEFLGEEIGAHEQLAFARTGRQPDSAKVEKGRELRARIAAALAADEEGGAET